MQRGRGASRGNRFSRLNTASSDEQRHRQIRLVHVHLYKVVHRKEWAAMKNFGSLTRMKLNADDGGPNASMSGIRKRQERM